MEPQSQLGAAVPSLLNLGHTYMKAPIVEALIEFRFAGSTFDVPSLNRFVGSSDRYAAPEARYDIASQLQVQDEGTVTGSTTTNLRGYLFRREDGQRALHAMNDRLAFSWLGPYQNWENFEVEALEWWRRFEEHTGPQTVSGLSVRFINQINIPSRQVEIQDYLRTSVDVSHYLPQMVNAYFIQVAIPIAAFDVIAKITSALSDTTTENSTSLILDIEIIRDVSLEKDNSLTDALQDMRRAKNYVFEASITDATRGLIS